MAKIFYSMSGEGRGHAARAATIVDSLRHHHDITLFAPHQAYKFLAPRYGRRDGVRVYPIPGLRFHYTNGKLALAKSIGTALHFWSNVTSSVDRISDSIHSLRPDLVVTDFEPLLPRAAERHGIPYVSFDHQHFLTCYDLSSLPSDLRMWASLMKLAVRAHYSRQIKTIVTSFFHLPLIAGNDDVTSVGPIVRQAIRQARPRRGDYLVSYLRRNTPDRVLAELESAPCEVRVYGLGERPNRDNLKFHSFDASKFVDDMAGCLAVVGAAGNQTLGEALYLGKPVLALPEDRHFEQRINAFYLQQYGYGRTVKLSKFRSQHLLDFIDSLDEFVPAINEAPHNGAFDTLRVIQRQLGVASPVSMVA